MSNDGKKIEIDGPVEIVIGKKEETKKASAVSPTNCKDSYKLEYPEPIPGVKKLFMDERNNSTQKTITVSKNREKRDKLLTILNEFQTRE